MRPGQTHAAPARTTPSVPRSARLALIPGQAQTAWQATIAGTLNPGDRVLVLGAGPIPMLWADLAARAGQVVEILDAPQEDSIARRLGADRFGAIKAVFAAHDGTDPGLDLAAVRRALDTAFHDALLLVDTSATNDPPRRDWHADIVLSDAAAGLARLCPRHPVAAE